MTHQNVFFVQIVSQYAHGCDSDIVGNYLSATYYHFDDADIWIPEKIVMEAFYVLWWVKMANVSFNLAFQSAAINWNPPFQCFLPLCKVDKVLLSKKTRTCNMTSEQYSNRRATLFCVFTIFFWPPNNGRPDLILHIFGWQFLAIMSFFYPQRECEQATISAPTLWDFYRQ